MKNSFIKKGLSIFLAMVIVLSGLPFAAAQAAEPNATAVLNTVADPGTAHTFEDIMGTDIDGNRYAGRVWVDKSVYTDGQTAVLNTSGDEGSTFKVNLEKGENFQTIFSALGSSMTTTETTSTTGPIDIVLVFDTSTSMNQTTNRVTRLQRTIEAANRLLKDLVEINNIRIGIASYNYDSDVILPLDYYTNGVVLSVNDYVNTSYGGVITAKDKDGRTLGADDGYQSGTNLHSGINEGMNMLANATNVTGRKPVAVILTDGEANRVNTNWHSLNGSVRNAGSITRGLALATLLNAAYNKAKIENNYNTEATVYSVSVDLGKDDVAHVLMNPASASNGFNSNNRNGAVRNAYNDFINTWSRGNNVSFREGSTNISINHDYPKVNGITDADIVSNINYVDVPFDVSSASLEGAFDQIYEELISSAFNPITSTEKSDGATGVENTPLLYVDHIGKYMEVKNIQAVTLFGKSYAVTNTNGVYSVEYATGTNPTTNEDYVTSEDIQISVTENIDGTEKLEIRINQEILPIILEQVAANTVNGKTVATINELTYGPLRVYYTVGVDSDILLPNGEVDLRKIDKDYAGLDIQKGEITLYSNQFGVTTEELDINGKPVRRDAHVGFKPSPENRYYYHQSNQGIFTRIYDITKPNHPTIEIEKNDEYGVVWNDDLHGLDWMTYDEYLSTADDKLVYTYVSYYRPTPSFIDNPNAAELVTYLVYTEWEYLKPSVAFYDAKTKKYVNYNDTAGYTLDDIGKVMTEAHIAEYVRRNPTAEIYAVLGMGSMRTSRFHNMTFAKEVNATATNPIRYEPQYTEGMAAQHHGNDVVVWLGNNGKLTLSLNTGIALSKAANEAIGDPDDTYTLTLKIDSMPVGETADPVVHDVNGNDVPFTFANNTVKVNVKVGETVYISGIPEGSECTVGEEIPENAAYRIESISSKTVTVPTVEEVMNGSKAQYAAVTVTNTLNKYGNLYISKGITSDHTVPDSVLNEEFVFEVNLGASQAGKAFDVLNNGLTEKAYADQNGVLEFNIKARHTIEILNIPEGLEVTVTEKLKDSQKEIFKGVTYRAHNHSGEDATETTDKATVIIPSTGNATAVVINEYVPKPVTVDLDVVINKTFADESVKDKLLGGNFEFLVQKYNTTDKKWEIKATKSISYAAQEYATKSATIENVLANEVYTTTGTYAYQVLEVKGNVTNVSYDRTIYTFDVVVTDSDGQLVADVTDLNDKKIANTTGDEALDYVTNFNNTYETAPISMDIEKVVNNLSGDNTVSSAGFKFRSIPVDANGNPVANQPEDASNTIFSDAAGKARMSGVYTKSQIGTHHYLVYEENTGKAGWSYSEAQYLVTVVVYENNSGKLVADMSITPFNDAARGEKAPTVTDNNKGQLYFTNTYAPGAATLNIDPLVRKSLSGKALSVGDFTFELYENGKTTALLRGTNDANGKIDLKAVDANNPLTKNDILNFTQVGKYEFDIKEVAPAGGVKDGITYDTTIYDLVIEVINDTVRGELVALYYFEDSTDPFVTFKNYYSVAPTTYTLSGKKVLNGRPLQIGEFEFALYEGGSTTAKEVVKNHANGSFEFSTLTYNAAGVYNYTIAEVIPSIAIGGVSYDTKKYNITVTVTDNGDGTLTATADVKNNEIIFTNTYTAAPVSVTFKGTKEFKGGELKAGDFAFNLYQTDHNLNIYASGSVLKETKTNSANGEFNFATITYTQPGTYFYVIDEDDTYNTKDEVVYDSTQHGYRVQVRDYGTGQLIATVINMDTGATESDNANIVSSFVNATYDEATEKEVAKQENAVAKIDGEFVEAGEILTYYIYYYNYTGKEVTVEIDDTIPAYTSYVEGSASHGGVYEGGNISWILSVPRGGSVMVKFDVEVDEGEAIVANTAIARDGVNTYTTNTVNNHTYKDPAHKEVVMADDVDVSIDGKKVYEGDELIYFINYTNTSYDTVNLTITDEIPEYTTYVDGSASNGGVYSNGVVTWQIEDVKPWTTVTVAFMVTVDENIGAKTISNKADVVAGNKPYTTNIVTNYTVEDEVKKEAFVLADPTINIDGEKVSAGDELVYKISYKNTDTEAVTVTITDEIPENTTYVEGSADNGGIFTDGKITWNITVPAGETVEVSFKVTVNDAIDATITNIASVIEGRNEYTTNAVVITVEKEEPEIPENPEDPEIPEEPEIPENPEDTPSAPEIPKTGDYTNFTMLLALVFISGGIVTITSISGKKRKTDK